MSMLTDGQLLVTFQHEPPEGTRKHAFKTTPHNAPGFPMKKLMALDVAPKLYETMQCRDGNG